MVSDARRALAVGIFNSGTAFGNALAVPVTAFITLRYGWRSAFVFTGALGFIWVIAWALVYRHPHDHPRLGKDERELIDAGQPKEESAQKIPVLKILECPKPGVACWPGC